MFSLSASMSLELALQLAAAMAVVGVLCLSSSKVIHTAGQRKLLLFQIVS